MNWNAWSTAILALTPQGSLPATGVYRAATRLAAVNSRTRIEAAIALEVADRPPVGAWGHSFHKEWSVRELADTTLEAQRRFRWDFVKFQPRATCFSEPFGSTWRPSGDPLKPPELVRAAVQTPRDWSSLPKVDRSAPPLADQVASIGMVASELGPDVPVIQTVFSPLTVADYLLGKERGEIVNELQHRRELIEPALDVIADALIDFSRASFDAGAAGIFFAISGHASRNGVPIDLYEEAVLPYDQKVLDSVPQNAWFNVLHLCKSEIYFQLTESLPSHGVSWSIHDEGNPSLEEGIARSGRAALGGLDHSTTLVKGPAEDIAQEVKSAAAANHGRGVIVAPGCSVPPETPDDQLALISESVEE